MHTVLALVNNGKKGKLPQLFEKELAKVLTIDALAIN